MPYAAIETDGGYVVINIENGRIMAKHTTKNKAEAQIRLLESIDPHKRLARTHK
jgi:hypothetical protein